jgi:hypothetical protein
MRRLIWSVVCGVVIVGVSAVPALACGGLIGVNGAVNLVRTTTLAGYHDGVEHYVTAFQFAGGRGEFGSIIPLPGVPTSVDRGGAWTLPRLVREAQPPVRELAAAGAGRTAAPADSAAVLLEARIDALDVTVLRGGAAAVAAWAAEHGFLLPRDAPAALDFYARRSPIFLAARFDADAVRRQGLGVGDAIPVEVTIPTPNPWVPLRILGLGRLPDEGVDADVFLLTDERPALLPGGGAQGLVVVRQEPASPRLLADLRADQGGEWVPPSSWLTYVRVAAARRDLTYDLAVDASGAGRPSAVAAGVAPETAGAAGAGRRSLAVVALAASVLAGVTLAATARRSKGGRAVTG